VKTILIANFKGGVAKTTSALTFAHGLALRGKKTLLIDLDRQANATINLIRDAQDGLYKWLVLQYPLEKVVVEARPNLFLVPSDQSTEAVKRDLMLRDFRELALKRALKDAKYDVVILDAAPSEDVLHLSAMVVADIIVIPTELEPYSVYGIQEVYKSLAKIQELYGQAPRVAGILPVKYVKRRRESALQGEAVIKIFGAQTIWEPIPEDTKVRSAPNALQTLWEFAPNSPAMVGFEVKNDEGESRMVGGYIRALERLLEAVR
jgi:chromosome partitioning protein